LSSWSDEHEPSLEQRQPEGADALTAHRPMTVGTTAAGIVPRVDASSE
jgi:hypothetical protein